FLERRGLAVVARRGLRELSLERGLLGSPRRLPLGLRGLRGLSRLEAALALRERLRPALEICRLGCSSLRNRPRELLSARLPLCKPRSALLELRKSLLGVLAQPG